MAVPLPWRRIEKVLVILIALHSYAVAFFLLFLTQWGVRFGGWEGISPLFFARQAGVFHAVVATGYLLEHFRYRGVGLLLVAKLTAVVFLDGVALFEPVPWAVPVSALGDGLMGLAVLLVHRQVRHLRAQGG